MLVLTGVIKDLAVRDNLKRIIAAVNNLRGGSGVSGSETMLNNAAFVLNAGLLYGYDANGVIAIANPAGGVRAAFCVGEAAFPQQKFRPVVAGEVKNLRANDNEVIGISAPVYAAANGRITTAENAGSMQQYVGLCVGERTNANYYPILVSISASVLSVD